PQRVHFLLDHPDPDNSETAGHANQRKRKASSQITCHVCHNARVTYSDCPSKYLARSSRVHATKPAVSESDVLYVVVYERADGRMVSCPRAHRHFTPEDARACADKYNAVSIIEWRKDRRPQFQEFWRRP